MNEFVKSLDSLVGKEVTLLDFDNKLHPMSDSESIFEYDNGCWTDWNGSFSYRFGNKDVNIYFDIIDDKGIDKETKIVVLDWEYI